jgi:hypothetical protein
MSTKDTKTTNIDSPRMINFLCGKLLFTRELDQVIPITIVV